ncbi:MAG: ABC transporter ATP-binding protein [Deltaproteobacteria bacterium]|nr:ABC transporter ATP-binding protein [Deltaproteobacteria bacterium]
MSVPERAALVRTDRVSKVYGTGALSSRVLHAVSFEIRQGELTLLMGPSGSGKTTLISILAGLQRPSGGRVELCGHDLTRMSESDVALVRRRHLGFVFQTYNLFPALTALENVAHVLRMKGASARQAEGAARDALGRVGLGERVGHRPGELSGGQKQRVAIARALAGKPSLVIGDEVTAALDSGSGVAVMKVLRAHVATDAGVLLVTHDHRLEAFADRVLEIEDGRIVADRRGAYRRADEAQQGAR